MARIGTQSPWVSAARAVGGAGGFALGGPVGAALIGAGTTLAQNIWSARRADTAHRREVKDLMAAGINPIHSARGAGAPVGEMQDVGKGVSSALEVRRARAEIAVLEAQARQLGASARQSETIASEISSYAPGRAAEVSARTGLIGQQESTTRDLRLYLVEKAKEEVSLVANSARAAKARALLDEAAQTGALNEKEFQQLVGELGPATKFLMMIIQGMRR